MTADELRALLERDPEQAESTVQALANQGVIAAQILFGRMLLDGNGLMKSQAAALAWFEHAGQTGDAEAINMVGRCLENGWGTEPDAEQAFSCYGYAAKLGDKRAQFNVGHMYLEGKGVPRDAERAAHWYAQAASQGHARAMNSLARCHEEGWGVSQDMTRANDWYRRSAEAGYFRAQYNWATALVVKGRIAEAADWLLKASHEATADVKQAIVSYAQSVDHPSMRDVVSALAPESLDSQAV